MSEYEPTQQEITVARSLGRIEGKIDEVNARLADMMAQVKDHTKRIERLEHRQTWMNGWVAGAFGLGMFAVYVLERL